MEVAIREAGEADAPALASLLAELGYPASTDAVARRLERLARSDADVTFVAVVDGEIAGLAGLQTGLALEYDEPVAKLSALVVAEAWQSHGIGSALARTVEDEARRRACGLLYLTSADRRSDAHVFYRQLGFEQTGRRFAKRLR